MRVFYPEIAVAYPTRKAKTRRINLRKCAFSCKLLIFSKMQMIVGARNAIFPAKMAFLRTFLADFFDRRRVGESLDPGHLFNCA